MVKLYQVISINALKNAEYQPLITT